MSAAVAVSPEAEGYCAGGGTVLPNPPGRRAPKVRCPVCRRSLIAKTVLDDCQGLGMGPGRVEHYQIPRHKPKER